MKTASRIQIALTLVTMAALALAPSATAQTDRYRSGAGTWDATTTNWGTATGGPSQARRTIVSNLNDDFRVAAQTWTRVPSSPELNRRWQAISQSLQSLINAYR